MTTTVAIHLKVQSQSIPFLSIPLADIERLSVRPFKWLRYVTFSICGARGDLSAALGGPPVDYDSLLLAEHTYYCHPSADCVFVDHETFNDRLTSTRHTIRSSTFRRAVKTRDICCIITRDTEADCDAAHLISRSKGSEYIDKVVKLRSHLYDLPLSEITDIDDVQNGAFLNKLMHAQLGDGRVAFLKSPVIYALPSCTHITLQHLRRPDNYDPALLVRLAGYHGAESRFPAASAGANVDAIFRSGIDLPPAIILDYVYGAAAYNCWRTGEEGRRIMKGFRAANYPDIPLPAPSLSFDDGHLSQETEDDSPGEQDDPSPMATAMDEMNAFLMYVNGITPQEAAKRREKRMEEAELKAQEASRIRVMDWMGSRDL